MAIKFLNSVNGSGTLHFNGADDNNGKADFAVKASGGSSSTAISLRSGQFQFGGTDINYEMRMDSYSSTASIRSWDRDLQIRTQSSTTDQYISLWTSNLGTDSEKMRITGNGNVGIGTTSPGVKLHVAGGHFRVDSVNGIHIDASYAYGGNDGATITIYNRTSDGKRILRILPTSGTGWSDTVINPYGANVGIGTLTPSEKLHVAGNITADEYKYNGAERVESKNWKYIATVSGGYYEELGQWRATEGNIVLRITVASNTSAHSGTAIYILQGGFNQAVDGWFELLPAFKGGGHGQAQGGWKVLWYDNASYTYKLAVAVPSGLTQKNLHVSVELLSNPEGDNSYQYTALSTTGVIPSYSLDRDTSYSHRDLISNDTVTAQYDATNYTVLGYDSLDTYGGSQVFKTAGTERMRIASNGNVGIGATSPSYPLVVKRTGSNVVASFEGDENTYLRIARTGTQSGEAQLRVTNNGNLNITSDSNISLTTGGVSGTTRLYIRNNDGNVGIGTSNPNNKLQVVGDIDASNYRIGNGIKLEANSSYTMLRDANGVRKIYLGGTADETTYIDGNSHKFRTSGGGTVKMTIASGGNVGIGTTSPAARLHVNKGTVGEVAQFGAGNYQLTFGVSTTYGEIQAVEQGVAYRDLLLNRVGGNVGISTTSPSEKLHVAGNIKVNSIAFVNELRVRNSADTQTHFTASSNGTEGLLRLTNGSNWGLIARGATNSPYVGAYYLGGLNFRGFGQSTGASHANDRDLMRLDFANERVGIGTTNPVKTLHVAGSARFSQSGYDLDITDGANLVGTNHVVLKANASYALIQSDSNHIYLRTGAGVIVQNGSGTEQMRFTQTGRIGIGTTSPDSILDIRKASGTYNNAEPLLSMRGGNVGGNQVHKFEYTGDAGIYTLGYAGLTNDRLVLNGGSGNSGPSILFYDNANHTIQLAGSTTGVSFFNGGNVGVGTTSPSKKLHVSVNDGDGIHLSHGGSNAFYIERSGSNNTVIKQLRSYTSVISISTIADAGTYDSSALNIVGQGAGAKSNVGIGTNTPSYKLDVAGLVDSDGYVNNNVTFKKSFQLGNVNFGTTYALGQLDFGGVYTHHFKVTISSYGVIKEYDFHGYQNSLNKLVKGHNRADNRYSDIDVIIESIRNGSNEITGVKIGVKNGSSSQNDYVYSATVECLSQYSDWTDLSSNTTLTEESVNLVSKQDVGGEVMYINQYSQKVGIGTFAPETELHVNGTLRVHRPDGSNYIDAYVNGSNYSVIESKYNGLDIKTLAGAGTPHIRLLPGTNGNVGIGTTSPVSNYKLHVDGTGRPALFDSTNAVSTVKIANNSTGNGTYSGLDFTVNSTSNNNINSYGMPLVFGTSSTNGTNVTERMRITSDGKVGIGTTSPAYKFVVDAGGTYAGLFNSTNRYKVGLSHNGTEEWWFVADSDGSFRIHENAVGDKFTIKAGGNVGIGTTSPGAKLDVNGEIRASLFRDRDNTSYYINPSGSTSAILSGKVGVGTTSPAAPLHVEPASDYKVIKLGGDTISHYTITGFTNHTLTLTCGSYYQAEVVITANQTNSGGYNNWYVRGIWSNNHTSHHWDILEEIGYLTGSDFSFTNGQNDVENSGKLTISHTYNNGSFVNMTVRVTDMYGTHSYSIS
jgi:hypothetical protein